MKRLMNMTIIEGALMSVLLTFALLFVATAIADMTGEGAWIYLSCAPAVIYAAILLKGMATK